MLRRLRAFALLALPLVSACWDNQELNSPDLSNNNGLFQRYAAIGTSISAGFQSAGINDSTQRRSFAFLVAQQGGAAFGYPSIFGRGCPAPLTNNVTQTRVGGGSASGCDLRSVPVPTTLNNVAVPGMQVVDVFSNTASAVSTYERLQTFFLGGQTPWNALKRTQPTFVSIELGANDVLGALLASGNPGNPDSITPIPVFESVYSEFADSVDGLDAAVVVATIPDVTVIPYASSGTIYWCLKNGVCPGVPANPAFANVTVSNACAPGTAIPGSKGDSILVPWTIGVAGVLASTQPPFTPFALDCANTAQVVTPEEFANMRNTTDALNQFIVSEATTRGWTVVDANAILAQLRATGQVPLFPDVSQVPTGGSVLFGPYFTLDGFHPSNATHAVIADSVIAAVNRDHGTSIPLVGP